MSSDVVYEVKWHPSFFVDIKLRSCSCGKWQQNGLPCEHVANVIHNRGKINGHTLSDYIEPYFHVPYFEASYSKCIHPFSILINSDNNASDGFIFALVERKLLKMPRKKRIPFRGKVICQIMCSCCLKKGSHNRKS